MHSQTKDVQKTIGKIIRTIDTAICLLDLFKVGLQAQLDSRQYEMALDNFFDATKAIEEED